MHQGFAMFTIARPYIAGFLIAAATVAFGVPDVRAQYYPPRDYYPPDRGGGYYPDRWDGAGRGGDEQIVQSWFQRYMRRSAHPADLDQYLTLLRRGAPPEDIQAAILASPEYYQLHGATPDGFVLGLYADILGRSANREEVYGWLTRLRRYGGDRWRVAAEFVREAQTELQERQWDRPYGGVDVSRWR
jgi:hypothetical protein